MDAPAITWEQTRAFRLERMHLVEPLGPRSLRKVVKDLGGIHAQVHSAGVLQAAARLDGMSDGAVETALWKSRSLVKTWMMRGTIHYVAAEDLAMFAAASASRRLWNKPYWQKAFGITAKDVERATKIIPKALDGRVLTREAIADEVHRITKNKAMDELLRSGWGSVLKILAGEGHLCFGPSQGRNVAFTRPDQWLEGWSKPPPDEALAAVLHRYLASHGPASRAEFARWWGFSPPDANGALEALENDLVQVDREGEKAFILKRDLKAVQAAEEDDRVRMLPMFDPYTLAGLPHDQIVPKAKKDLVYRKGAWVSQVVLRGGRVVGVWTHVRKPKGTVVEAALFKKRSTSIAEMNRGSNLSSRSSARSRS